MEINFNQKSTTLDLREWLVTNGIGSYASGTISGILTRSYHGILIAALKPPLERNLLVTKIEETIEYKGKQYPTIYQFLGRRNN